MFSFFCNHLARLLRHLMAPPELLEIAKHRCFKGTLYRFEHISPAGTRVGRESSIGPAYVSRNLLVLNMLVQSEVQFGSGLLLGLVVPVQTYLAYGPCFEMRNLSAGLGRLHHETLNLRAQRQRQVSRCPLDLFRKFLFLCTIHVVKFNGIANLQYCYSTELLMTTVQIR